MKKTMIAILLLMSSIQTFAATGHCKPMILSLRGALSIAKVPCQGNSDIYIIGKITCYRPANANEPNVYFVTVKKTNDPLTGNIQIAASKIIIDEIKRNVYRKKNMIFNYRYCRSGNTDLKVIYDMTISAVN